MKIGKQLKEARMALGMTQEKVADEIQVTRQTISNWETEKSYPDIISVIRLSDLYQVSLDVLLKGDKEMMNHLEESTNLVSSNKKLITAAGIDGGLLILFILFNGVIARSPLLIIGCASVGVTGMCFLFYQIIRKF